MKNRLFKILIIVFFFFIVIGCNNEENNTKEDNNKLEMKTYTVYEFVQYGQNWTEEDLKKKNMKISLEVKDGNMATMTWNGNIMTYKYDDKYFIDTVDSNKYEYYFEDDKLILKDENSILVLR
jgi:hypothetical protein